MFQLADASILPVLSESLGRSKSAPGSVLMSGLIIIPQIVVAGLAPWVGYHSEKRGRKPLLLAGCAAELVRAGLLVFSENYAVLVVAQMLDGLSGATIGVLTILIVTDLTAGTGRFNLARGVLATLSSIAASISTTASGLIFQEFGHLAGFLLLTAVAGAATAVAWAFIPETKPAQYMD